MNEKNVTALNELLQEGVALMAPHFLLGWLAEFLAERGVLVPAALSDEEALEVTGVGPFRADDPSANGHRLRSGLERIAKGDERDIA